MEGDKIYTATDLSRYHAGNMSAGEMHALEKAALTDPFLADALEGYALVQDPGNDIAGLQQQLKEKAAGNPPFFLSPRANNGWLRIAAMLIVFAGIAYLFYRTNDHTKTTGLAKTENHSPAPVNIPPPTSLEDSSLKQGTVTVSSGKETPVKKSRPAMNAAMDSVTYYTNTATTPASSAFPQAPVPAAVPKVNMESAEVTKAVVKKDQDKNANRDFLVKGNVTDEKGKPVEGASVNISGNMNVVTDQKGRFKATTNEAVVNASVASQGYVKKDVQLSTGENKILLDREYDEKEKTEVIQPAESNKQILKKGIDEKAPGLQQHGKMESIDSVVFIDYLAKNMKPRADSIGKDYEGKVVLSFTVSKKGRPENIRVDRSLCQACDEQAIQLLKNGPRWIYAPNRRKQVTMEY